ncbi:MAG: hypothetical protein K6U04_10215 [Armatimonadetes bacterium]|nr:hypothetical protein [Armatimonadota bacterium]
MDCFICDTCGQDVKVYEGVLSWLNKDGELSNFRVTHRDDVDVQRKCEVRSNNERQDLYKVSSFTGYLEFVQDLLSWWTKGFRIKDFKRLKEIMGTLSLYINEKLSTLIGE